ncbi:MAG: histidine phosphatase family protein [Clostridia bacterium]|nr:histidine phosphatase family protein [Clostridia bacterium]
MAKFYVIRHCEAMGNREKIFQGTHDGEVSELGKLQLDYLSLCFRNEAIDSIYSSSRKRALATARAVNLYHHLDIQIDDRIMEINAGEWEGKAFSTFPKLFPKEMYLWDYEPYRFVAPNGESMQQVYDRMVAFVLEKAQQFPQQNMVLASHGCAIRNLLCWAEGLGFEHLGEEIWPANTGVSVIEVGSDLKPHLLLKNDISHLPEEMRTLSSQKWNAK